MKREVHLELRGPCAKPNEIALGLAARFKLRYGSRQEQLRFTVFCRGLRIGLGWRRAIATNDLVENSLLDELQDDFSLHDRNLRLEKPSLDRRRLDLEFLNNEHRVPSQRFGGLLFLTLLRRRTIPQQKCGYHPGRVSSWFLSSSR